MQNLIITRAGQQLAARLVSGESVAEFTRLAASDHDYSAANIAELEGLSDIRQEALIPSVKRVDGSVVEIMAAMDNSELTDGYSVRAIGLFAKENEEGEVLFAVAVEPELPFYMPPYMGKTVSSVTYRLNVKVCRSDNVVFEANSAAYVTVEQLAALGQAVEQKADVSDIPTALPADGGNAETVNGHTVLSDVPANAKFTDTTYSAATASASGLVDTGAQTFAGNKTFNGSVYPNGASSCSTAQARKLSSGTAAATVSNCAAGCWYGQYE